MIISKTPLRVSFFGGGTDIPEFYQQNKFGGAVLGTSIDKYIYHSVFKFPSKLFDYNTRISYSKVECVDNVSSIEHTPFREILNYMKIKKDVEIHIASDLPSFSGLGTSSSFTVGLLKALHEYKNKDISKKNLAKTAIHIERNILNEAVGCQDQTFAAFGGFNLIEFKNDNIKVNPLRLSSDRMKEFSNSLMLFYTGIKRRAHKIESEKIKNINNISDNLNKILKHVQLGFDILDSNQDLSKFGYLLHETWKEKRSLSSGISNKIIDSMYDNAVSSGALGGKLLGAGGGGFLLLYVPEEKKEKIRKALSPFNEISFSINTLGSKIIHK